MKIYLSKKFKEDFSDREFIESLSSIFAESGVEMVSMVRDCEKWGVVTLSPAALMQQTFEIIDSCDAVLVEFSEKGVGVGIEVGYAHAKGKPIHVIAKESSDISATLRGVAKEIIFYTDLKELPSKLYF